jgi:hypothetical protein
MCPVPDVTSKLDYGLNPDIFRLRCSFFEYIHVFYPVRALVRSDWTLYFSIRKKKFPPAPPVDWYHVDGVSVFFKFTLGRLGNRQYPLLIGLLPALN